MAPNVKSMGVVSRHLSLLDLSSMTRSHSFQALSRAVSDIDLQQIAEPEFLEQDAFVGKEQTISEDYWGWDDDASQDATGVFDAATQPLTFSSAKPSPAVDTASYWDWPADASPMDADSDVLSLANIEANLVQAANQIAEEAQPVASHDDYWAEASSSAPVQHKPQHQQLSYWDWPTVTEAETKQAQIDALMQHEAARILTSVDAIEQSLRSQASKPVHRNVSPSSKLNDDYWAWESKDVPRPSHVTDPSHPDFDYWTWNNNTNKSVESSLAALLAYERARVLLAAAHTEQTMQKCVRSQAPVVRASINSDEYWDNSTSEALGDAYWDERPSARVAANATGASYWDW